MEQTKPIFEQYGHEERYTLIATATPQPAHQSTNLFEGINE